MYSGWPPFAEDEAGGNLQPFPARKALAFVAIPDFPAALATKGAFFSLVLQFKATVALEAIVSFGLVSFCSAAIVI